MIKIKTILTKYKINQIKIKKIVEQILIDEGYKDKELSILFVNNKYIEELNLKYRKIKKPINVISFPLEDTRFLGDIVISLEFAHQEAKKIGLSFKEEICILLIHGLLQLLGFYHKDSRRGKKIEEKEERLVDNALCYWNRFGRNKY